MYEERGGRRPGGAGAGMMHLPHAAALASKSNRTRDQGGGALMRLVGRRPV